MKCFRIVWSLLFVMLGLAPCSAGAAPRTAYVEPFRVSGSAGETDLPATLQALMSSRLTGDLLLVQDSPAGVQILVKGSFIQFGKVFSIDVAARDQKGVVLARAYELGEGQDELPKTLAKVAEKLTGLLAAGLPANVAPPALPLPMQAAPAQSPAAAAAPKAAAANIVKPSIPGTSAASGDYGARITGMYIGMAFLRTLDDGDREVLLIKEHSLHLFRQGARTEQLAEASLGSDVKVLNIDTIDMDGDGSPEIYLTVMRGFELASQVWTCKDRRFVRTAENLPYYFRVLAAPGTSRKLYAQEMGRSDDYYGPVAEVVKSDKGYNLRNPFKLPKLANIYNFNMFADRDGIKHIVVLHPDGFLVVFSESGEELWRSSDKYGGSEVYFSRDDSQNLRFTGAATRKIFIEQRITVAGNGEILVPKNGGFFVVGDSRNYSKDSLYAFNWNGSVLDARWHTKEGQSYLADYFYDELRNELVMLEVVKREGFMAKGGSVISVKKVE